MKRVISILALTLCFALGLSAQNNTVYAPLGVRYNAAGELIISDPCTTLQVQLTVTKEQVVVGPYAKYAQKFLDVRPSLVERTTYAVTNAKVGVVDKPHKANYHERKKVSTESYLGSATEFARVSAERTSSSIMSTEDAAQQAAQAIFSIRRHRMELITGEAGENVFGAGLKEALETLDKKEQEYLELFLGKKITTTSTHTFTIALEQGTTEYTLARFKSQAGLLPASANDGNIVALKLTPSATEPKFNYTEEVEPQPKVATIAVRLANMSTCSVTVGDKVAGSAVLPVFELGRTVHILAPAKK